MCLMFVFLSDVPNVEGMWCGTSWKKVCGHHKTSTGNGRSQPRFPSAVSGAASCFGMGDCIEDEVGSDFRNNEILAVDQHNRGSSDIGRAPKHSRRSTYSGQINYGRPSEERQEPCQNGSEQLPDPLFLSKSEVGISTGVSPRDDADSFRSVIVPRKDHFKPTAVFFYDPGELFFNRLLQQDLQLRIQHFVSVLKDTFIVDPKKPDSFDQLQNNMKIYSDDGSRSLQTQNEKTFSHFRDFVAARLNIPQNSEFDKLIARLLVHLSSQAPATEEVMNVLHYDRPMRNMTYVLYIPNQIDAADNKRINRPEVKVGFYAFVSSRGKPVDTQTIFRSASDNLFIKEGQELGQQQKIEYSIVKASSFDAGQTSWFARMIYKDDAQESMTEIVKEDVQASIQRRIDRRLRLQRQRLERSCSFGSDVFSN